MKITDNPISEKWESTTLGDICNRGGGFIHTGPFGSQLHASDYVPSGVPSIMPVNIGDNQILTQGIARISEVDAERLSRYRVKTGDIVYSRRGDVERCSLVRDEQNGWLCGTGCLMIRLGDGVTDPRFASFYLKHPAVKEWILRHALGATMPNLNTSIMQSVPFVLPPFHTQHAIARILGSLDDKIELNRQMNETLEAMARAIFKSWFVDFDPVRAKAEGRDTGLPPEIAALFPDGFEEIDEREVPKGWELKEIRNETSTIQYGLTQSASQEEIGPKFLRITDIQGGKINWDHVPYCAVSPEEFEKYRINIGDIFVARTGASTGENIFIIDAPNSVFASYLVRFQFKSPGMARVVGEFMRSESYFDFVSNAIGGSAQPNASAQVLASVSFVCPTSEIAEAFGKMVAPSDKMRAINEQQSRTLAQIRDALLPKLMSGEIRIESLT